MQTIQLQIEDNKMDTFLTLIKNLKDGIVNSYSIDNDIDENLKQDPFFYERQKELHQIRDDIKSGKMKMYEWDEAEEDMDKFEIEMASKYAN
jgi:hypothetical protein